MRFNIIQSGSKGNATIVEHNGCVLLIDMGITLKSLRDGLAMWNKQLLNIDALLVTHSHGDHTSGIRYLDPLPIYCTKETYSKGDVHYVEVGKSFYIKDIEITPIEASHDAINAVGYILCSDGEKLVYLTDTGFIPDFTIDLIKNADYYIIEANHDRKMLLKTNRPEILKQRILSDCGHLCNEDSAFYMADCIGPKTKEIVLAHLSQEANTPEKALSAYEKVFRKRKINTQKINIHCANQFKMTFGGKE